MSFPKITKNKLPKEVIKMIKESGRSNIQSYCFGDCSVIMSQDPDGKNWLSIHHSTRLPNTEEIFYATTSLLPTKNMGIAFRTNLGTIYLTEIEEEVYKNSLN